jgi:hypothetical protein
MFKDILGVNVGGCKVLFRYSQYNQRRINTHCQAAVPTLKPSLPKSIAAQPGAKGKEDWAFNTLAKKLSIRIG